MVLGLGANPPVVTEKNANSPKWTVIPKVTQQYPEIAPVISSDSYEALLKHLEQTFNDEVITNKFEEAKAGPEQFLKNGWSQHILFGESEPWYGLFVKAIIFAQHGMFKEAKNELEMAKRSPFVASNTNANSEPNMPDILFLSSLVNYKLKLYEDSLRDLKDLYILHGYALKPWNKNSEIFAN